MLIDYYSGKFIMTDESCAGVKKQSTLVLKLSPTLDDLKQTEARLMCNVEFCKKSFTNKAALQAHTLTIHTGTKNTQASHNTVNYFCSILTCPHSLKNETSPFLSLRALKQHMRVVHTNVQNCCQKCKKTFKSKYSAQTHAKDCGLQYICSCNVAYTSKRGLLAHIQRQNHVLPQELKSLFNSSKKPKEVKPVSSKPKCTINHKFILPKTTSGKLKIITVPFNTQTPGNTHVRNVIYPTDNNSGTGAKKQSKFIQFTTQAHCTNVPEQQELLQSIGSNTIAMNTWNLRDFSSQTDGLVWLPSEEQVKQGFCGEHIATQTIDYREVDQCRIQTERMCQTGEELNTFECLASEHIHGANFYLEQQCNKLTGAESSNRELDLPVHIETQTEMNFCQMQCTAQTQTRSDSSNNNNSTEIRSLDDLLNDIETQTDTLFTWPSQMNNVISSYTQTATEPDKEDDILSHLFNIETQTEW